jgi:hypothetical protein
VTFPFKGTITTNYSFFPVGRFASAASRTGAIGNRISSGIKYPFLLIALFFVRCILEPSSNVSEGEAKILREILRENGYSVTDNEKVDKYLEFHSSNPEVDYRDRYYLLLPAKGKRILIFSEKFNLLNPESFMGVKTINHFYTDSAIDSIAFVGNSMIKIPSLFLENNQIKTIPKEISYLRTSWVAFSNNQISALPEEIMQIFDEHYYVGWKLYLDMNIIDTLRLSGTMKTWLSKYADGGSEWWKYQNNYSNVWFEQ